MRHALLLLAAAAAVTLFAPPAAAHSQPPRSSGRFPAFPYLLHRRESDRAKWEALGEYIWEFLKEVDFDFVGSSGYVVPPGVPGSKSVTGVACGHVSRLWVSCRRSNHSCTGFEALGCSLHTCVTNNHQHVQGKRGAEARRALQRMSKRGCDGCVQMSASAATATIGSSRSTSGVGMDPQQRSRLQFWPRVHVSCHKKPSCFVALNLLLRVADPHAVP